MLKTFLVASGNVGVSERERVCRPRGREPSIRGQEVVAKRWGLADADAAVTLVTHSEARYWLDSKAVVAQFARIPSLW